VPTWHNHLRWHPFGSWQLAVGSWQLARGSWEGDRCEEEADWARMGEGINLGRCLEGMAMNGWHGMEWHGMEWNAPGAAAWASHEGGEGRCGLEAPALLADAIPRRISG
jgi:hypothetical protein